MDEFSYRVALEKGLSVWNDTCGTDNKIAAKCLGISQPDVNWPVSYWDKVQSVKKQTKKSEQEKHRAVNLILTTLSS